MAKIGHLYMFGELLIHPHRSFALKTSTLRSLTRVALLALSLLLVSLTANAWAQTSVAPAGANPGSSPAAKVEGDPFGRETPQGMVAGLMNALAAGDYERAVQFFATDSVQGVHSWDTLAGSRLARRFQEVLDRAGTVITPAELSNDPSGNVNDGLAQNVERFGVINLPNVEVPLLAKRVTRDGKSLWLVSEGTLNQLSSLRQLVDGGAAPGSWIDFLPEGPKIGGAPASHWFALFAAACLSLAVAWLVTAMRGPIERLIRRGGAETKLSRLIEKSAAPARILIMLLLFGIAIQALEVSVVARYRVLFLAQLVGWFAVAWLLWRLADAGAEVILGQMSRRRQLTAYSAVSFLNRAIKVLLAVLFIAALMRAFGINVTAGLAALGVGGLAIALGAQKLFENVIGSLTLIADSPVEESEISAVSGRRWGRSRRSASDRRGYELLIERC